MKNKIKINDNVKILCGKDKGKIGRVIKKSKDKSYLYIKNIKMVKKHKKNKNLNINGIIYIESKIHISNVKLI